MATVRCRWWIHIGRRIGVNMIRGLALNLVVFGVLFVLHIVAAANDMDAVFRFVAVLISVQVIAFGPFTVAFSRLDENHRRRAVLRWSTVVGAPLALGLAWAYGGMAWSLPEAIGIALGFLVVHAVVDRRWSETS